METTCESLSDKMSCKSMSRLAQREVMRNSYNLNFLVNSPACKFNTMRQDKVEELELFASNGITRKLCFDPETYVLDGPWKHQLEYIRPVPNVFIANTRPKLR
jgi:hypothetical protein